jgi:FixJ family two-component response regulator/glycine cleavage system H lipoate-binding protein
MFKDEKILVIDDEQVILDAVTRIASFEDIKVDSETNSVSALKMLTQKKYSLVLCDILMPDMDGFSVLEEIQNKKLKTPVIMITGFSTVENAVKSLYKGAIDFIAKPFTFEEIKSAINRGLQYSRLLRKIDEAKTSKQEEPMAHVPCPPKYHRLGNISWIHLESEGVASLGVSDLFLETIEKLKSINLMDVESQINQGESCANFITDDELEHHFLSPVSGRILRINERLLEDINLLEKDPYFEGWVYKIIPADLEHDMKFLVPCASDRM